MLCNLYAGFEPSQLSCLGSLVGKSVAWRAGGRGFESHLRQPIFLDASVLVRLTSEIVPYGLFWYPSKLSLVRVAK